MSRSSSTDETPSESFLTDEEIETFEYLLENAENFPDPEFVEGLARLVLQGESSAEVMNS